MKDCPFEEKIIQTHKALFGDGDPKKGMIWMVEQNTDTISDFKKNREWLKKHWRKILLAVLIWMGSSMGSFLITAFKAHVFFK